MVSKITAPGKPMFLIFLLLAALPFAYPLIENPEFSSIMRWILYGAAFIQISFFARSWIRTIHLSGFSRLKSGPRLLALRCRRSGALDTLVIYVFLLSALAITAGPLQIPLGVALAAVIIWSVNIIELMKPPAVLVLGVSGPKTLTLQAEIWEATGDLHTISLLDWHKGTEFTHRMMNYLIYRTSDDARWEDTMRALEAAAHIVVVDVRESSTIVVDEVRYMLSAARQDKTYFVKGKDGEQPALVEALADGILSPPNEDQIQTQPEVLDTIGKRIGHIKWAPWV